MMNGRNKGFTLVELLIVIAIVAILVALAIPSFQDAVRKSRRSDAMDTIMEVHLARERFRVNNPNYGLPGTITTASPGGHYSVSLIIPTAPNNILNYSIVATALNDQASDACGNYTLAVAAGTVTKTAVGDDSICWKQ